MSRSRWTPVIAAVVVVVALLALLALGVGDRLSSAQAVALMLLALLVGFFTRSYGSSTKR